MDSHTINNNEYYSSEISEISEISENIIWNQNFFCNYSIGIDIWSYIFSYCDIKLIKNISETCNYFNEIFKNGKFIIFLPLSEKQILFQNACCDLKFNIINIFLSFNDFDISFDDSICFYDACKNYYYDNDWEDLDPEMNDYFISIQKLIIILLNNDSINPCCHNNNAILFLSFIDNNNNKIIDILLNHNQISEKSKSIIKAIIAIKQNNSKTFKNIIKSNNLDLFNNNNDEIIFNCILHGRCEILSVILKFYPYTKQNIKIFFSTNFDTIIYHWCDDNKYLNNLRVKYNNNIIKIINYLKLKFGFNFRIKVNID